MSIYFQRPLYPWVIRFSLRSVYYIVLPYYCFACVTQRRAHDEGCFGAAATSVLCHSRHTVHTLYHHHHLLKSGGEKSGHEKKIFGRDPFLKKNRQTISFHLKTSISIHTTKQLSYQFFFHIRLFYYYILPFQPFDFGSSLVIHFFFVFISIVLYAMLSYKNRVVKITWWFLEG